MTLYEIMKFFHEKTHREFDVYCYSDGGYVLSETNLSFEDVDLQSHIFDEIKNVVGLLNKTVCQIRFDAGKNIEVCIDD